MTTAIFYNPETQRPEFRYACHWQPTREPHGEVAKAKVALCSSWAPWEFSTLQSRKLRNAFSSSKIREGHRIIEFHPWLGENWAERWLSEQNRSCSVKGEPLSESPALLLTVPRFPLIIFPLRISQTQPSLISRAQIAHGACYLSSPASPLTSGETVFWNVNSASFDNACLTLFREPEPQKTFVKYMVIQCITALLTQGLPELGLFGVSLPQKKIKA